MFNNYLYTFFSRVLTARNQLVGMILTSCALAFILYNPSTQFNTTDQSPALMPYIPQKMITGAESTVEVHVGMFVMNFPTFDMMNNNFVADVTVWFEFDPSLIPLEIVQKFSFERGTILSKSEPDMKITENKLFVQYSLRVQFTSNLNFKKFPLNDHRLYLTLVNKYVTPRELIFFASRSSFMMAQSANTQDWIPIDRSAQVGYFKEQLDAHDPTKVVEYPGVVFAIDLAKKGIRKIFIILLPMAVLFFISLFTFALDPKTLGRSILTISTGTLSGLIAYRFVIEKIVPDVGYFTFTDHVFNLFLSLIFVIFLINIYLVNRDVNDQTTIMVKGFVFLLLQLALIVSFALLIAI